MLVRMNDAQFPVRNQQTHKQKTHSNDTNFQVCTDYVTVLQQCYQPRGPGIAQWLERRTRD